MRLALRELRRSTRRFVPTTAALALLVMLLLFLGGLLDGLYLGSTGALRAQDTELVVYSDAARESVIRSRIDAPLRAEIESVPGVRATYGLGFALVGARVPGESELADAAVVGYQGAVSGVPAPPPPGQAWADRQLEAFGVEQGDRLLLGPARVPVTVRGFVEDTNFLQQGGLWVEPRTWREVLTKSRPGATVGPGTFQVVTVRTDPGAEPEKVAKRIDTATAGATSTITADDAVLALPGIKQQNAIFTQIISVTFLVAGLVVALFFALLTLERIGIFAVLKAIGASSRQLVVGLFTQIISVTLLVAGLVVALFFALLTLERIGIFAVLKAIGASSRQLI
ncbi:MAG: ABC transporter permease, partial [Acidimicrobiia bacterium]|nr:ABC transporter permease [Acidimicrobiia bacterium]